MKVPALQTGYALIIVSIILNSCAQLVLRIAIRDFQLDLLIASGTGVLAAWMATDNAKWLMLGVLLYGLSMLIWIRVLSRFAVSLAYPLMSLSYILVYFGATQLPGLAEQPSILKLAGIVVIVAGVYLVAGSNDAEASAGRLRSGVEGRS